MNRISLFPLLFAGILLGFQGCSQEEPINDLFAGTSPGFEISEGGSIRHIPPMSLFIRVMDRNVEYEGNLHPLEPESEDEEKAVFSSNFPLAPGLSVSGVTFQKSDRILLLELEGLDRKVELEQYDRMIQRKVNEFAGAELTADISHLSDNQKEMLNLLFRIADIMDEIYWEQVFPDREAALGSMTDENLIRFFRINYGPWERLNGNLPFMPGYGPKPPGSGFYPADMTMEEFEALPDESKTSQYTLIRRNDGGNLEVIPYHVAYAGQVEKAAGLLRDAGDLAEDDCFKKYLNLRADALLTDEYFPSDMAWMEMKEK
jgi:hypothetical protein